MEDLCKEKLRISGNACRCSLCCNAYTDAACYEKEENVRAHHFCNSYCRFFFAFFGATGDADGRPSLDVNSIGSLPAEVDSVATCD